MYGGYENDYSWGARLNGSNWKPYGEVRGPEYDRNERNRFDHFDNHASNRNLYRKTHCNRFENIVFGEQVFDRRQFRQDVWEKKDAFEVFPCINS